MQKSNQKKIGLTFITEGDQHVLLGVHSQVADGTRVGQHDISPPFDWLPRLRVRHILPAERERRYLMRGDWCVKRNGHSVTVSLKVHSLTASLYLPVTHDILQSPELTMATGWQHRMYGNIP